MIKYEKFEYLFMWNSVSIINQMKISMTKNLYGGVLISHMEANVALTWQK
jgi:hypothetical protein